MGWDDCQAIMQRSLANTQLGYPPSWPSQQPSSCANESYRTMTTYSTTEMLAEGEHTLWHGVATFSPQQMTGAWWIR